jgi:hypothetical protein
MADVTYYIENGMLYKSRENDGYTYLRHGPESEITALCPIEEAESRYPEIYERLMRQKNAICQ